MTMHPARRTIMAAILAPLLPLSAPATAAEPDLPAMQADADRLFRAFARLGEVVAEGKCTWIKSGTYYRHEKIILSVQDHDIFESKSLINPYHLRVVISPIRISGKNSKPPESSYSTLNSHCFKSAEQSLKAINEGKIDKIYVNDAIAEYGWKEGRWSIIRANNVFYNITDGLRSPQYGDLSTEILGIPLRNE